MNRTNSRPIVVFVAAVLSLLSAAGVTAGQFPRPGTADVTTGPID
jgi:hypothetical protein